MSNAVLLLLLALVTVAAFAAVVLFTRLQATTRERDQLVARFRGVVDADAERTRVLADLETQRAATTRDFDAQRNRAMEAIAAASREAEAQQRSRSEAVSLLERQCDELAVQRDALQQAVAILDEQAHLFDFGLYTPRFDCATSQQFAARLDAVREQQKTMIKARTAAVADAEWSVNGSKAEGRKQNNQTIKLLLRAFNGECDAAVAKVRYNNVQVMCARIEKAYEAINGLAQVQQCRITPEYFKLKLDELLLEFEYEERVQAEKEEQRRIREQMREEEIARREIEKARLDAEKDEERAAQALEKARREVAESVGAKQAKLLTQITELELRLAKAAEQKQRAISRAQLTRSGHVYVISNLGSFGEHVYKIGMTRRLDPMERIRELGDASVPFDFDVHAVIYSDDAPGLEAELHRSFTRHRVNRVNERKEFFRVPIEAIAEAVRLHRAEIEITLAAQAMDYRKTLAMIEEESGLERGRKVVVAGAAPGLATARRFVPAL